MQKSVLMTPIVREMKFVSMVNVKKAVQMIIIAKRVKNVIKNPVFLLVKIRQIVL